MPAPFWGKNGAAAAGKVNASHSDLLVNGDRNRRCADLLVRQTTRNQMRTDVCSEGKKALRMMERKTVAAVFDENGRIFACFAFT